MKTNRIRSLGVLLGALITLGTLSAQAWAGAPSLMTYQGRLKESGLPVTGSRNVNIFLCPCLSGACAPACTDTFPGGQSVSVANGLFRTTFTVPSSVDLTTGQWYLEVQIGAVALAPREQLTSSPYALYASSASTLVAATGTAGVSISTSLFVIGGGNVGIGTTVPATLLDVNGSAQFGSGVTKSTFSAPGALTLARDAGLTLSGALGNITTGSSVTASAFFGRGEGITGITAAPAGADGQVQFNNTGVTGANANFFWDNVNKRLGVGITNPAARLHVSSAGAVAGDTIFQASSGAAAGQELLVVKGDGRVGFAGVLEAAARLTLPADGLSEIRFPPGTNNVEIESSNQMVVGTYGGADVALKSANLDRIRIRNTGEVGIGTTNPSVLFQVGAGTLAVTAGGNVGIGTTSPATPLDVAGAAQFGSGATKSTFTALGDLRLSTGAFLSLSGPSGTITGGSSVTASGFFGSGAGLTGVSDSGKVLKAGDTMTGQLTVTGASVTVVNTAALDAYSLAVTTATNKSVYHLYVATAGWVGIGTDSNNDPNSVNLSVAKSIAIREVGGSLRLGGLGGAVSWGLQHYIFGATTPDPLLQFIVSGGTRVHINSAGLVGIGTTSPEARLHVSTTGVTAATEVFTVSTGTLNSAKAFVVNGNGAVGIGTTDPEGKLSVTGDVGIGAVADTNQASHMLDIASTKGLSGFSAIRALFPAGGNLLGTEFGGLAHRDGEWKAVYAKAGTGVAIALYTDGEVNMMNGNVGIGTTGPSATLHVSSVATVATTPLLIISSGTAAGQELLRVQQNGNLGIGTTNPTARLEVVGGRISGIGSIPSGMIVFSTGPCPLGWTEYTLLQGRAVVGKPAGGTNEGTVGTALINLGTRNYTPAGTNSAPTFTGSAGPTGPPSATTVVTGGGPPVVASDLHTHSFTPAGTVSAPTFSGTVGDVTMPYIQLTACQAP